MSDEHKSDELDKMRHSAAHVMAEAVLELFPDAKLAIGPSIEEGFYYDFDLPAPLAPEDLGKIEELMRGIIAERQPFVRAEISREKALEVFSDQPYKVELIKELPEGETISAYTVGGFTDLCRGPHVAHTGELNSKAIKLLSIAGAYWRGDEHRPMLQRVYGTAWSTPVELQAYLDKLAEIERRDHRRLGKELDLYSFHEEAGAGLAYWHAKGGRIRNVVETFWRDEHYKRGYDILFTPHIAKLDIWKTSGHWGFYRENMYSPMDIDGIEYLLKPMNCPFAVLIYKTHTRSYRDLPLRWGELGTCYRYEKSGVLHGMLRVRGFTQDDAHLFLRPDQLEQELVDLLELAQFMQGTFGYKDMVIELSVRDPLKKDKYVGSEENWVLAEDKLVRALERKGLAYARMEGEAKFYGPAIDIKTKDALGRAWQGPTIQVDFNFPDRFDLNYVGEDGQLHRPVMVHRTILGSMERFVAGLVEHYAGAFPVWLAPVQAMVIPIADRHKDYARQVERQLKGAGYRVEIDASDDRMNAKIRNAQLQKVPYMLVIGDREMEAGAVAVRKRTGEDLKARPLDEFFAMLAEDVKSKVIW